MFSKQLPAEEVQTPKRARSVTVRLGWVTRGCVSCQAPLFATRVVRDLGYSSQKK